MLDDSAKSVHEQRCVLTRGHGLGIVVLVGLTLTQFSNVCRGVSIIVWAADVEKQTPEIVLFLPHPLVVRVLIQG